MLKGHVFDEQLFGSEIFAVFTNTFLDGENGVVQGFGNSMAVSVNGSDLTIQSGVVCIQGRFLQEDTSSTITAGTTPAYARLIVEINLNEVNTENTFLQGSYKIITDNSTYPTLTQTDIVNNVSGIYQYSLGRFQITANGIANYVDERTYLDFTSIYGEISEHISAIDNEKIFMPIGSGCDYYGNELPNENYMWADGSAISRSEYAGLFAVIGTTYGAGDGTNTFNLPDKRSRVSVMAQSGDDTFANLGTTGGEKKHILTNNELPKLSGSIKMGSFMANSISGASVYVNPSGILGRRTVSENDRAICTPTSTGRLDNNVLTINFGNDESHNNLQPYLVCNYIIRVK